jgi:hypothetical protein
MFPDLGKCSSRKCPVFYAITLNITWEVGSRAGMPGALLQDNHEVPATGIGKPPWYGYPGLLQGLPIKGIISLESGKKPHTG